MDESGKLIAVIGDEVSMSVLCYYECIWIYNNDNNFVMIDNKDNIYIYIYIVFINYNKVVIIIIIVINNYFLKDRSIIIISQILIHHLLIIIFIIIFLSYYFYFLLLFFLKDTVTGFILAGVGHKSTDSSNFLVVKSGIESIHHV